MNRSTVRIAILVLGLATAVIHLYAGFGPFRPPLILNAVGYLVLLGAFFLNLPFLVGREKIVRYALIGYALLTFLAWIPAGDKTVLGFADKLIEVLLAGLLLFYDRLVSAYQATSRRMA